MRYSVASLDREVRRSHFSRCDKVHICGLLRQRAEMYMNEYGVNEGVEV